MIINKNKDPNPINTVKQVFTVTIVDRCIITEREMLQIIETDNCLINQEDDEYITIQKEENSENA